MLQAALNALDSEGHTSRIPLADEHAADQDEGLRYPHADLAAHTRNFSQQIDDTLAAMDRTRMIGAALTSYVACSFVVGSSDLIATLPFSVADGFKKISGTTLLEVPLALPLFNVSVYWHERYQKDPAHAWVRQLIDEILSR